MKKLLAIVLALVLCIGAITPVFAEIDFDNLGEWDIYDPNAGIPDSTPSEDEDKTEDKDDKEDTAGSKKPSAGASSVTLTVDDFTDVAKSAWYYDAVAYVTEKGLMNGVGEGRFAPESTLTRAMIVTVLYRLENEPEVVAAGRFTDVPSGQWYSEAIAWAADCGVVGGYGDGKFGPSDPVTREQLAAILYRYAGIIGANVTERIELTDAKVSAWAVESVSWAAKHGIVLGGEFIVANVPANRAEVANALYKFMTY
ncbi:MAG: S-layer homology domain-containing protein [Oscillospiraceae bacterium]|nr:S-layer homology domain-containing protein [Oscillospiraceae bacterium]